jgi:regulatory protein
MVKVTDIKQQVKRTSRYSIYFDGKYLFSLSEGELLSSGIRIGKQYTQEELAELRQTAVLDKAYMRALDYVALRMRSRWELTDYLRRKDYDSPTIETILNKLSEYGYVDDKKFAEAWVSNRQLLKPTSLRRLQQELQQKRIDREVISEVLAQQDIDELAMLRQLIERKKQQTRYQDEQKLIAYLLRQGYRYDDVKQALSEDQI